MTDVARALWERFLSDTGRPLDTPCYECFYFCDNEEAANALLELVLQGKKTATASYGPIYALEGAALPEVGGLSMVTDFSGLPKCVIQTTAITTLPFCRMTYEICRREGEDDRLESWQENHRLAFGRECAQAGIPFREDGPVVFEDFQVVYRF